MTILIFGLMCASKKEQPVPAEWNFDFIYQQFEQICTKYVIVPPIQRGMANKPENKISNQIM
jgi:hypothetical protein